MPNTADAPMLPDMTDRSLKELYSLNGKVAVVTGGAWGLGKATARRLAEAGATVVIGDLDLDTARATAEELAQSGSIVSTQRVDCADEGSIIALADHAMDAFGRIDIWVNNAGVPSFTPLLDLDFAQWDKVMAVNLRGAFAGAREAAKRMIANGHQGVIVNVASLAGVRGISSGQAAYCSSKHGVVGLTRQLSIELGLQGIRVMGVAPGFCLTEKTMHLADLTPEQASQIPIPGIDGSNLGRVGVADDIARVILFCASDMSLFMTGSTLLVDGGVAA